MTPHSAALTSSHRSLFFVTGDLLPVPSALRTHRGWGPLLEDISRLLEGDSPVSSLGLLFPGHILTVSPGSSAICPCRSQGSALNLALLRGHFCTVNSYCGYRWYPSSELDLERNFLRAKGDWLIKKLRGPFPKITGPELERLVGV